MDQRPENKAHHTGRGHHQSFLHFEAQKDTQPNHPIAIVGTSKIARGPKITIEPVIAPVAAAVASWTKAFSWASARCHMASVNCCSFSQWKSWTTP